MKNLKNCLILMIISMCSFLATGQTQDSLTIKTTVTNTIDSAKVNSTKEQITIIRETPETVYVTKKVTSTSLNANKIENKAKSGRERGIGFSGGFYNGLGMINLNPVKDYLSNPRVFSKYSFNISNVGYELFPISGGTFYAGIGNGIRIGFSSMNGERNFSSNSISDTMINLKTEVHYNTFLLEKCIIDDKFNYLVGACLGTGQMSVEYESIRNPSVFYSSVNYGSAEITSQFGCFEIHGGATYTVLPFVHIGGEISLPTFISYEGFPFDANEYFTVNPVIKLKVVFGNLG